MKNQQSPSHRTALSYSVAIDGSLISWNFGPSFPNYYITSWPLYLMADNVDVHVNVKHARVMNCLVLALHSNRSFILL